MRVTILIGVLLLAVTGAVSAFGAEIAVHGDLNHRFMLYTNHNDFLSGGEHKGTIADGSVEESWGDIKYRVWMEAASDDGNVRGVYAIELGALHFGKPSGSGNPSGTGKSVGGSFSGDNVNIETRWAYTDIQLPGVARKARVKIGLQPFAVNRYLWQETAMGVNFVGSFDVLDYQLAWMRGIEADASTTANDDVADQDNILARVNLRPAEGVKFGVFGLYQTGNTKSDTPGAINSQSWEVKSFQSSGNLNVNLDLISVGVDGSWSVPAGAGAFFFNWDAIYQTGTIRNAAFTDTASGLGAAGSFDVSSWFGHADVGYKWDRTKLTYRFWYTSGDDDPTDKDFNGFLATDIDINDSIALFEGGYTDDDYFSERHYLFDRGFIMNRLGLDYQATDRLRLGLAGLYMLTGEDIVYTDDNGTRRSENELGYEVDGYASFKLYDSVELAVNAGYLVSGDAMDVFEAKQNGSADEDIFVSTARIRYRF